MSADDRAAFEAAISSPPYERDIARWPDDQVRYAWPGAYKDYPVALAWDMWQAAAQAERGRCAGAVPVAYSEGRTLSWHKGRGVTNAQLYAAPPAPVNLTAIIDKWLNPAHIRLHAGEMTAQEVRTVLAVVNGIKADIEGAK